MEFMPSDEQWKRYFLGPAECEHDWETLFVGDVVVIVCKKCGAPQ